MKGVKAVIWTLVICFAFADFVWAKGDIDPRERIPQHSAFSDHAVTGEGYIVINHNRKELSDTAELKFIRLADLKEFMILGGPEVLQGYEKSNKILRVNLEGVLALSGPFFMDRIRMNDFEVVTKVSDISYLEERSVKSQDTANSARRIIRSARI